MTAIKQTSVMSREHLQNLKRYFDWDREKVLEHDTQHIINEDRWFEEMDATREAAGHNRPGKQGARCTYMQHQVIGFNPDECSCNGGPMTPSRCMEYARDYIAKRYPNQEIVIVLHEERCRSDGSARFAAHLAINRTDLETGRRLNDGPARAAAKSRVRTVKDLDAEYGLKQLERGLSNSKVHARQPGREEREMAKKGRSDKSENARVRAIIAQRAEEVGRLKSCPDASGSLQGGWNPMGLRSPLQAGGAAIPLSLGVPRQDEEDQRREARLCRQPLDRADHEVHGKGDRPRHAGRLGACPREHR